MADVEITGKDPTIRHGLQDPSGSYADDEDLIDYDSDDAFAQNLSSYALKSHGDLLAHDVDESAIHSEPEAPAKADSAVTATEQTDASKGQTHQIDGNFLQEDCETTALNFVTDSVDHSSSHHEIDYDAHDFTREENPSQQSQHLLATASDQAQSPAAEKSEVSSNTSPQGPVERYEIDWEDDEVQDATDQDVSKTEEISVSNAHTLELGEQVPERNHEDLDFENEDTQPDLGEGTPQQHLEGIPTITVQYRGEEYPFFSPTSNGFFTEISILDKTMEDILGGFRAELSDEIGPQDDLVFHVDRLGLEFSESSPSDALQSLSMRQILELLEILVKNQDCENDRLLPTYLFTRPNTMKRYEFLIERATRDAGLADVIHLFPPPRASHSLETMNTSDDDEGQPERHWSANHDSATQLSHNTSGVYDENTVYDNDLDVRSISSNHGMHKADADENPGEFSHVDDNDSVADQEPEHERRASGVVTATDEANVELGLDCIDNENAADDPMTFDAEPTVMNLEDEAMDTIASDHEEDQSESHDTPSLTSTGFGRTLTELNDTSLIQNSSTHDKFEAPGDWLATDFPTSGDEDTGQQVEELLDFETSGDRTTQNHDEDLIDYESGGDAADDEQPGNDPSEAPHYWHNGDSQHGDALEAKYDTNLIDYSTDGKHPHAIESVGLGKEKDSSDEVPATKHEDSCGDLEEVGHELGELSSVQDTQAARDHDFDVEINEASMTASSTQVHQDGIPDQEVEVLDGNEEEATYGDLDGPATSVARQPPKSALETVTTIASNTTTVRVDEEAIGDPTIYMPSPRHLPQAVEIDWDGDAATSVDLAGGTAEAQPTTMTKRAYSAELDEYGGNNPKRRWS